ncbi:hypothetical protein C8R46DRAFT_346396 [Mycena filopes]|nr:hypothetical protein C8R46DRAFT_346396 [Mycena filopes]
MNPTTAGEPAKSLPNGYPYIWLEAKDSRPDETVGMWIERLAGLPRPIVRPTGRRRQIPGADGGEAVEVVIMLSESELAHCCYYCARPEQTWGAGAQAQSDDFKKIGGEGYSSTYVCYNCPRNWFFTRVRSRLRRDMSNW